MKIKNKLISLCSMTMLALACILLPSHPALAKEGNLTMSDSSATSFTITWEKPEIEGELLHYRIYDVSEDAYLEEELNPDCIGATFSDLKKGYVGRLRVDYEYVDTLGIQSEDSLGYVYVNTTPVKLSTRNFGIDSLSEDQDALSFYAAKPDRMTGTQITLYKGSKKVTTIKFSGSYSKYISFTNDKVYKYRARTYYKNTSNQKTYYGAWSNYRYFDSPTVSGTYSQGSTGCKLKLKKVSGVDSYSIQVAANEPSDFRQTATLTIDSGKNKSIQITKIGKKKMKKMVTYYIRIIPNLMVDDKIVESDIFTTLYFVNPM